MKSHRQLLLAAASIAAIGVSNTALAQDAALGSAPPAQASSTVEELVVTGIRAAQKRSVDVKRDAVQVLDSISAEDIGKLPDITISDSLQRITGVQIRREAGEGGSVNIRGLPQVTTLLNGEEFLGANSINTVQPNFGDIPSQLLAGADVMKSPTASLLSGGITGTINLKTRRPFDLKSGLTAVGAVEGAYGSGTKDWEPRFDGLLGFKGSRFGALIAGSYSDTTQANYYNGAFQGANGSIINEGGGDAPISDPTNPRGGGNGDGDTADRYISFEGHESASKFTQRKRVGVNASFQYDFGGGVELTGDVFYTDQTQHNNEVGLVVENKWQAFDWFTPLKTQSVNDPSGINTVQVYDLASRRLKSFTNVQRVDSNSTNINLQLKYDKGGRFTGTVRGLYGKAKKNTVNTYIDIDMATGEQWGIDPTAPNANGTSYFPGGYLRPNPNGYSGFPRITVDYTGKHMRWANVPAFVSNVNSYNIGAISSEGNSDQTAKMGALRADGRFEVSDNFSIDGGLRYSSRKSDVDTYDYAAPFYDSGCLVKWKATDVVLNGGGIAGACTAGDAGGFYTALKPTPLSSFGSKAIQVTDFGPVKGAPAIWAIDPKALKDPLAFNNALFPGNVRVANPGASYRVKVDQTSAYLQANFKGDAGVPVSGNAGLRVIQTDLKVTQNLVGAPQPYGVSNLDAGDLVTNRKFTDFLPAFNVAFDLRDDVKLRLAYAKTMTLLNLNQWGGALTPSYAINSSVTPPRFEVIAANSSGNPNLDPWRADNYDASLEWYVGPSSLVNVGLFYVRVDSFIANGTVNMPLPDQDGVVRRNIDVVTQVQGEGGTLKGAELGLKQSFDFLPGLWSNFGVDANYTFSPSNSGRRDITGKKLAFQDNSEHQVNLVLWYQGDKLQFRIADNYRSKRVEGFDQFGLKGLTAFQKPTNYVDASVSYDVTPNFTAYVQGSNLTKEYENYYYQWKSEYASQNVYERRVVVGVRARF
jgi:TonB-dependent receptor